MTIGARRLSSRSLAVPKTFARALSMIIAGWLSHDCSSLVGEERHRVRQLAVHPHFVVEMGAGRAAGGADIADDVAPLDALLAHHRDARQMAVLRDDAEAVVERDHVA